MRLLGAFDKWMIETENYPKRSHYASDISSCKRQQFYRWTGEQESNPKTPGNILKMKFGRSMELIYEQFIIDSIKKELLIQGKKLISYEKEVKFVIVIDSLKYPITCKIDFILYFDDGTKEAIELKSSFGRGIINISKTNEPKKDYLDQIYIYINLTPYKRFNHPYFGRDNGYRTEFEVLQHEKGIEVLSTNQEGQIKNKIYEYNMKDIIDKLEDLERSIEINSIPDRDFLVAIKNGEIKDAGFQADNVKYNSDWQCLYCEFMNLCWSDELQKWKDKNNSTEFIKRKNINDVED